MVRNMILLVHDHCMWPRTHPGCPVTRQNVCRVLGKALKIFATIVTLKTIVQSGKGDCPISDFADIICEQPLFVSHDFSINRTGNLLRFFPRLENYMKHHN